MTGTKLSTPVRDLKDVGPKRAALLQKIGLSTVADLLSYYPGRYQDRRLVKKISRLEPDHMETIQGTIVKLEELKPRTNLSIVKAWIKDETGSIAAVWFNQPFIKKQLKPGGKIMVYGKVETRYLAPEITVHDYERTEAGGMFLDAGIVPVYASPQQLPEKILRKILFSVVHQYAGLVEEFFPESVMRDHHLMERSSALRAIHFPSSMEEQREARRRLAFEELFLLQLGMLMSGKRKKGRGISQGGHAWSDFERALPFALTGAQKRVMGEILRDMQAHSPMARLVQGDVGSGKTVVAAAALYQAAKSGYQGAMMAPTEILAEQHHQSLSALLGRMGIKAACLSGSTPPKERECLSRQIENGEIDVVVGTHALIQDQVSFKSLSLAITDEQHRFGVMQREGLRNKGAHPDVLVMTATPIPRTLALTLYGDLDLSLLEEMPPGRKEVKTYAVTDDMEKRVLSFIAQELKQGKQAYIVCPLVEESEKLDLRSAAELAERLRRSEFKEFPVALLHGRMKPGEKNQVMEKFRTGKISVLVSTTVIEVGVNVPNATVMLIRDAERFGLAQLHQLRGRVGRGEDQAYCFLMHHAGTREAWQRMKVMESTHDGFKIAEADLELRGPGDFFGSRQHGWPGLKIADIFQDAALLEIVRGEVISLLTRDPELQSPSHRLLAQMVQEKFFIGNKSLS